MSPQRYVPNDDDMTLIEDAASSLSSETADRGVDFPLRDGDHPSTPTAKAIFSAAADVVDTGLAEAFRTTGNWRAEYVPLVRRLTKVSSRSPSASLGMAHAGLRTMAEQMTMARCGTSASLVDALTVFAPQHEIGAHEITGYGDRVCELEVPYRGRLLRRATLLTQLDRWVEDGIVEPSFAVAIGRVVAHPEWLALPGQRVMIVGAGSEMGPMEPLSSWGARLIAVDIPRADVWSRILDTARRGASTVTVPTRDDGSYGLDVVSQLPETRRWVDEVAGDDLLTLGMYAYADRGLHVRVTAAVDALAADVLAHRPKTSLAYLATPTDAFVVDDDIVAYSRAAYRKKRLAPIARMLSAGRLFAPSYDGQPAAREAHVADVLVSHQGPNYALAKRLQRWRGVAASGEGRNVSFNVAPATWTRSVTKNRTLAAAYAGAPVFGAEIFSAATARVLMAALLVHDLHQVPPTVVTEPESLFIRQAAHSGLWRAGYDPRSVLGIAALIGAAKRLKR